VKIAGGRSILIVMDFIGVNAALLFSLALRPEYRLDPQLIFKRPLWFLILMVIWFPLAYAFDCYEPKIVGRFSETALARIKTGLVASLIFLLIPFLTPALPSSRLLFLSLPLFLVGLTVAVSGIYDLAHSRALFLQRTLVIGAGQAGNEIARVVREQGGGGYDIVGFVDDDQAKQGSTLRVEMFNVQHSNVQTFNVLGDRHALLDLVQKHQIKTLILAVERDVNGEFLQILTDCLELGAEIVPMPVLYENLTGRVPIEHVGSQWHAAMPLRNPGDGLLWAATKRLMDIVLVSLGFVCLAVAMPFIAAAIYIDSPGPIFYTQMRVGKRGRVFKAYKFRSMRPDAEKGKAVWAARNDCRVTRVGRILRKTHVDEFPQFWNILKGEMSVVGPRSERPEFVEELAREIPFYRVRHCVRPGMAGWGLVKQGYGGSKEEAVLKLQYDLYYIKHQSLWLDIVILIKTIIDTLTFRGR
jgi:exopolysaccharide biosynthesis polyprenyl glycosylphosphotransferase